MMKLTFSDYGQIKSTVHDLHEAISFTIPKSIWRNYRNRAGARVEDEEFFATINDICINSELRQGRRYTELYLARNGHRHDEFGREMLRRISQAQFRILQITGRDEHPYGIRVHDLIENRDLLWLDRLAVQKVKIDDPTCLLAAFTFDCDDYVILSCAIRIKPDMMKEPQISALIQEIQNSPLESQKIPAAQLAQQIFDYSLRMGNKS